MLVSIPTNHSLNPNKNVLYSSAESTLDITGSPIPVSSPIDVNGGGWTWISYYPDYSMDAYTALYSLNLVNFDFLKGQDGGTTFYEGLGWWPNINMNTGQGYVLYLANAGTLVYPDEDAAASSNNIPDNTLMRSEDNLIWDVEVSDYEFSGYVTVSIENENISESSGNDQLAVLVNGECRGVVSATYCPLVDEYLFPLMVYSNENMNEEMNFVYYSFIEDKVYEDIQTINFESDMMVGNVYDPYIVNVYNQIPDAYSLGKAYPNPFNPSTNIEFSISEDGYTKISVYNLNGRLVEDLVNGHKSSGNYDVAWNASGLSSGVYFITMNVNGFTATQKVMLVK